MSQFIFKDEEHVSSFIILGSFNYAEAAVFVCISLSSDTIEKLFDVSISTVFQGYLRCQASALTIKLF